MSTIGVRAAKAMGTTLSQVVKRANASGVIQMKPSGALTKAGKDVYQSALKREGVKSVEGLVASIKKVMDESAKKLALSLQSAKKIGQLDKPSFEKPDFKKIASFIQDAKKAKLPFIATPKAEKVDVGALTDALKASQL